MNSQRTKRLGVTPIKFSRYTLIVYMPGGAISSGATTTVNVYRLDLVIHRPEAVPVFSEIEDLMSLRDGLSPRM